LPEAHSGAHNLRFIAKATLLADKAKPPEPTRFTFSQEDKSMKILRFLSMCAMSVASATLSTAWAQTYTTVDFPGATTTFLVGGPNPQGTSVGQEITAGVSHGFSLTAAGVFTEVDPPGSTFTVANFISPEGMIVGQFLDASQATHAFVLYKGQYTTFDVPGALATVLSSVSPSGEMTGLTCLADPTCETPPYESFTVSRQGVISNFNPFGAPSSGWYLHR
jgi:hypothetical protein